MSRRPKVLHTMTWLAPGGGVDRNVYLSMAAMRASYDLHLAVGRQIQRTDFLEMDGISVHVCPYLDRDIHPWRDLRALVWFVRLIRRERFDLVHTHETKASLLGRLSARLAGCRRVIYGLHGVVFNDPLSRARRLFYVVLEKLTVGAADFIISVSRDAVRHYHRHNIGRRIPWRVVYSGIDVARFEQGMQDGDLRALRGRLCLPEHATVLVNVGRFSPAKAQRYTIEAFARLREGYPGLLLLLVGEGPERPACERLCRELGIEKDVIFAGFCTNVAPAFAIAAVHVLTSLREGLPSVAVEASLARVPTVAFEVEGVREIVEEGKTGHVVAQRDVAALADRVRNLLDDPDKRRAFGERARARAVKRWDHKAMVRELDAIYRARLNGTE